MASTYMTTSTTDCREQSRKTVGWTSEDKPQLKEQGDDSGTNESTSLFILTTNTTAPQDAHKRFNSTAGLIVLQVYHGSNTRVQCYT